MFIFTDRCISQIERSIAAFEPERGGALLCLPNSNVICEFVDDPEARVSSASYIPSAQLTTRVREAETKQSLRFAGVIHSHPGRMAQPSAQDERAFALALALNPHLSWFLAPIVTIPEEKDLASNQYRLKSKGIMTLHLAYRKVRGRTERPRYRRAPARKNWGKILSRRNHMQESATSDPRDDGVDLYKASVTVLPIDQETDTIAQIIRKAGFSPQNNNVNYLMVDGVSYINVIMDFCSFEVLMMIPQGYPRIAPVVLFTSKSGPQAGKTRQIDIQSNINGDRPLADKIAFAAVNAYETSEY